MNRKIAVLFVGLSLVLALPSAHAWPSLFGGKGKKPPAERYERGEHGPGTDEGRKGNGWNKHTDPRPGRDTTKNRGKPGWRDRSGKRKP